jgi:cytochrome c-type biogenesis protein CcmF
MSVGVQLPWKRAEWRSAARRLRWVAMLSAAFAATAFWLTRESRGLAAIGVAMAVWIVAGAALDVVLRIRLGAAAPGEAWRRARGLPRSAWGAALAHIGVGVVLLGVVGTTLWHTERMAVMRPGDTLQLGGYQLSFDSLGRRQGENYDAEVGRFTVTRQGRKVAVLTPERRWFPVAQTLTSQVAIRLRPWGDLYLVLGDTRGEADEARVVRAYIHPLVSLIWIGAFVMVGGGAVSLSDRRYRLGRPVRGLRLRPQLAAGE